jgi:hypothetical protein
MLATTPVGYQSVAVTGPVGAKNFGVVTVNIATDDIDMIIVGFIIRAT